MWQAAQLAEKICPPWAASAAKLGAAPRRSARQMAKKEIRRRIGKAGKVKRATRQK
jgi:hypothetical protein